MNQLRAAVIGGTRNDEDHRDSDQRNYCVHSHLDARRIFDDKYRHIIDSYKDNFEQLTLDMVTFFESKKQPNEEFERKMDFCQLLKLVIQKHNPNWLFDIVPTGSSVTGLATKDSDLDVAIHIPQANFHLPKFQQDKTVAIRKIKLLILQIIRRILVNDEEIKDRIKGEIQLVAAQIQILKIETTDGIECDISVSTEEFLSSMHNSALIRHFANIDCRFAPLCAVVKQWAASTEVKKPKEGGFNSYALVMLVVHFLQCGTTPPILPHLAEIYKEDKIIAESEHNFPERVDFGAPLPRVLPVITTNQSTVAELFFEFVHYYLKFQFKDYYISICNARVMDRRATSNPKVRIQDSKDVYIEDPFDAHNPGRTVRSLKPIKTTFRRTVEKFIPDSRDPASFKFPTLDDILYMSISPNSTEEPNPEDHQEAEDTHDEPEDTPADVPSTSEGIRQIQLDDNDDDLDI